MKKIILSIVCLLLLSSTLTYADEPTNCEQKKGYELYQCRVGNVCKQYDSALRVYNTEKEERTYLEGYNLYIARNLYRENMNNIYKCGMLKAQNNAYKLIQTKLDEVNPNTGTFNDRTINLMENLGRKITATDCLKTEKDNFFLKKQILDESTLEMCKYLHFLDYIDETHVTDLGNLLKDEEISLQVQEIYEQDPAAGKEAYLELSQVEEYEFQSEEYNIGYVLDLERKAREELAEEIIHTKKVYEVAFQTYANYESNLVIHILLELLENDFIILRNNIYATISPINQVVYKIANAMSN